VRSTAQTRRAAELALGIDALRVSWAVRNTSVIVPADWQVVGLRRVGLRDLTLDIARRKSGRQ
jgi:hypothetical protein